MIWHDANELPTKERVILIQVEGFAFCHYIVGKYMNGIWWQHVPRLGDYMPSDGYVGLGDLKVVRWAYVI